ncbi:hypothetical protein ACTJKN_02620 [Pedobacter sp. 22163]|uniref:hypothetical protein n=1 Tax=Pedobacter sp. 22163 TaxID=3453883 RepID=UPI003F860509
MITDPKHSVAEIFNGFSQEKVLVAHHEAGHVLGALFMGVKVLSCQLKINEELKWGGVTKYDFGLLTPGVAIIADILDGLVQYKPSEEETLLNAAKMRYCVAVAGPMAELKYLKLPLLQLDTLPSFLSGSDKLWCEAMIDFHENIGFDGILLAIKSDKLIDRLINQSGSWMALEKLACKILTADNHLVTREDILQIVKPDHLVLEIQ